MLIEEVSDDIRKSVFLIGDFSFKLGDDSFLNQHDADYIAKCWILRRNMMLVIEFLLYD